MRYVDCCVDMQCGVWSAPPRRRELKDDRTENADERGGIWQDVGRSVHYLTTLLTTFHSEIQYTEKISGSVVHKVVK
jgi:hypothetical protein